MNENYTKPTDIFKFFYVRDINRAVKIIDYSLIYRFLNAQCYDVVSTAAQIFHIMGWN